MNNYQERNEYRGKFRNLIRISIKKKKKVSSSLETRIGWIYQRGGCCLERRAAGRRPVMHGEYTFAATNT